MLSFHITAIHEDGSQMRLLVTSEKYERTIRLLKQSGYVKIELR